MEGLALAYFTLAPGARDRSPHMLYLPHPYRGYQLTPNITSEDGWYSHNAHAFRGREVAVAKPPATVRVVCLGGSTTYCTGATTDSRTYPAQMERMLRAHYAAASFTIEVINAGHPAYTSLDSLVFLETRLLDFSPDVAVFHHGLNDIWEGTHIPGFQSDYTHARHTFGPLEVRPWEYSPLLTLLFGKKTSPFNPYAPNRRVDLVRLTHHPTDDPSQLDRAASRERLRRCIETLERNTASFLALARGHGIVPVLSTMVSHETDTLYDETLAVWNERVRALAAREHVAMVDFAKTMPWNPQSFYDKIHLRDRPDGLQRKAEIFAAVLIGERVIERAAERLKSAPTASPPR